MVTSYWQDGWLVLNANNGPQNFLVTTAMGTGYFDKWSKHSLPSWIEYAERYGLGIICITEELINPGSARYKNGSWQKLLAPKELATRFPQADRIAMLDTDIRIGPLAPNIFCEAKPGVYSVVSLLKNLPFPKEEVLRRMAFFRHTFYSKSYPLDSFLLGDVFQEFRDLDLAPAPNDYFCAGLIVLDVGHADQMSQWFFEVIDGNLDAWEQTHLNYWIQNEPHEWLPYEFQAIWNYEMAWKYPFLYESGEAVNSLSQTQACVEASLWNNHFLHFAGSWYESNAWLANQVIESGSFFQRARTFDSFRNSTVTGNKVGKRVPSGDVN